MATVSRTKTWSTGETLTAAALNAEFDGVLSGINSNSLNQANLSKTDDYTFGSVIVGTGITSADGGQLHVFSGDASVVAHVDADEGVFESNGNAGISILAGATSNSAIYFGDTDNDIAKIDYDHSNNDFLFASGGTITLDAETDIVLDANGADIFLKDAGTEFGKLINNSGELRIASGSSSTTALSFAGANATFAGTVGSGAITSTGIIKTDDATEATSTTDGSLQTDGGLSVVKDAIFGDDVRLLSDSAVLSLGAGNDATLTHDGTTGVTIAANPITITSGGAATWSTSSGALTVTSAAALNLNPASGSAIVLDGTISIDAGVVTGATSITLSGELDAGSLDISGNADIDGTLEADAYTVDGATLAEYITDTTGAMFSSNTESGITVTFQDGDNTIDLSVDAAQTGITSLLATDIKIGEDDETKIDFETANEIHFYAANAEQVYVSDGVFGPQSDSDVDLGTTGVRWKDAFVDTLTAGGAVSTGALTSTGDISFDGGSFVFNESGADKDFRIEGDTNANLFVADASLDSIGIGTNAPGQASLTGLGWSYQPLFHVHSSGPTLSYSGALDLRFIDTSAGTHAKVGDIHYEDQTWRFRTVNDSGTEVNANVLFVDGAGAKIGIGTAAPDALLEISGSGTGTASVTAGTQAIFGNTGTTGSSSRVSIVAGTAGYSVLDFGDTAVSKRGAVAYKQDEELMIFNTNTTDQMWLDSSGNLGVGTAAPGGLIHAYTADAGSATASTLADEIIIESNANAGLTVMVPDGNSGRIMFTSPSSTGAHAEIQSSYDSGNLNLNTNKSGAHIAFLTDTASEAMRIDSDGRVGINTTTPDGPASPRLHIRTSEISSLTADTDADNLVVEENGRAGISILSADNEGGKLIFGSASDNAGAQLAWYHNDDIFYIGTVHASAELSLRTGNNVDAVRIDDSGNVGVGTATFGSSAAKVLAIGNGTAPGTSADKAQLYVISGELIVKDGAGNATTLSPHNFGDGEPSEEMAWSYHSKRGRKSITVDMLRVVRLLEKLTGEQLAHIEEAA